MKLKAELDIQRLDYFKPDKKGFRAMPYFAKFTKENIADFTFYAIYDHDDDPKFVLRCYGDMEKSFAKRILPDVLANIYDYSWIPIGPETISDLSMGHKIAIDNITLEMIKNDRV